MGAVNYPDGGGDYDPRWVEAGLQQLAAFASGFTAPKEAAAEAAFAPGAAAEEPLSADALARLAARRARIRELGAYLQRKAVQDPLVAGEAAFTEGHQFHAIVQQFELGNEQAS